MASPVSCPSHDCDGIRSKKAYFFAFLFAPRLAARFFGAARFFAARFFVDFFAARFFGAARFFADFFAARFFGAARFFVDFFAAFFGAAALRLRAFFFGASLEAAGVIIDIMSAIIFASPV